MIGTKSLEIVSKLHVEMTCLASIRVIQRIIGTIAHLHKINKNNYAFCAFCQSSAETIYHLFAGCPIVIDFWRNVRQWLQSLGIYLNLTQILLLFGVLENEFNF